MAVLWSIWKCRNKVIFQEGEKDVARVWELAQVRSWNWLRAKKTRSFVCLGVTGAQIQGAVLSTSDFRNRMLSDSVLLGVCSIFLSCWWSSATRVSHGIMMRFMLLCGPVWNLIMGLESSILSSYFLLFSLRL